MRGTGMWSDHRLVRSLVALKLPPPRRRQVVRRRKLNVSKLREKDMHQELQESFSQRLQHLEKQTANSVEEQWTRIKEATYEAISETLGFATSKQRLVRRSGHGGTRSVGRHALHSTSVDERQELLGQEDGLHSSQTEGAAQAP